MAENNFERIAKNAKVASKKLANLSTAIKDKTLLAIAESLDKNSNLIYEANKKTHPER